MNLCEGQGREGRGSNGYGTRTTENSGSNGRKNKGQCTKMQTLYKVDASTGEDGMNELTGGGGTELITRARANGVRNRGTA